MHGYDEPVRAAWSPPRTGPSTDQPSLKMWYADGHNAVSRTESAVKTLICFMTPPFSVLGNELLG